MITKRQLQDWNRQSWEQKNQAMYATHGENRWPWFSAALDPDIESYVGGGPSGQDILDVGTCSGSQAIELARRGHRVVGTDISETALEQARRVAASHDGLELRFLDDDIAASRLDEHQFDVVVDRGCYHSICSFNHEEYVANVRRVLKPRGVLLLKVMSSEESRFSTQEVIDGKKVQLPFHFTSAQLQTLFAPHFVIEELRDSYFYSSILDAPARAHFVILRNHASR
ncbi:MAG TPA: class I SAM-dependent methyltransferase [Povalibacter sp.]|nr:class I SAM-dependent methyltransferase [Povalibacter sp.]